MAPKGQRIREVRVTNRMYEMKQTMRNLACRAVAMLMSLTGIGPAAFLFGALAAGASAETSPAGSQSAGGEVRKYAFESNEGLAGWTITGDVTIDLSKRSERKAQTADIWQDQ